MNRPLYLAILVLMGSMALPCAAGTLYSWTDARGTRHFSDSPPPPQANVSQDAVREVKLEAGRTLLAGTPEAASSAASKKGPSLARAAGYTLEDIARNCKRAQDNMELLQVQVDAQEENPDAVDTETARGLQSQVDKTTQQIQLFCGEDTGEAAP